MKTNKTKPRTALILFATLIFSLLAACQLRATPTQPVIPSPDPALMTVAALQTENALFATQVARLEDAVLTPPSATPTLPLTATPMPSITPTPGPTISLPAGLLTVTHKSIPGYVFAIDPESWTVTSSSDAPNDFLVHKEAQNCEISIAPATAPGDLLRNYPRIIGRRGWLVQDYAENTFYVHKEVKLELSVTEDEDCIEAQETILADILSQAEYNGAPASTPAVKPTPRSALEGFICKDTQSPRLRAGDRAYITAGLLWLRKEPNVEEATEMRIYQQYAPIVIQVEGGPICEDGFVFWQVTVIELGEGGETFSGWMAESGSAEYFLDLWYLGW